VQNVAIVAENANMAAIREDIEGIASGLHARVDHVVRFIDGGGALVRRGRAGAHPSQRQHERGDGQVVPATPTET
jgi:hypothetical protein